MPGEPCDLGYPQGLTKDRHKFADVCSAQNLQVKNALYCSKLDFDYCKTGTD